MRVRYLTITLLLICVLLSACHKNNTDTLDSQDAAGEDNLAAATVTVHPDIRVGVSMQGLQRPYIVRVRDQLERLEKELGGTVDLIILDGQENAEKQNAQVEYFISKKVDVIIFNAISYEEGALGVELANEAGIPVVLLITTVANTEMTQAQAISDHKESALIQIDMVADFLQGKGNIVILEGLRGIESQMDRTEGYNEELKKYPDINTVEVQTANWTRADAYAIVENWIRLGKEFDAIVAQNDNMALGALKAVEEANMQGQIAVFGIDGDMDAMLLVREGRLQGTVYHDAVGQAERAIEYAIALANGENVVSELVPFVGVDRQNVDYYISLQKNK